MLVEDDLALREDLQRGLVAAGFEIHPHATVRGAVATLKEVAADVVLTALNLDREMRGLELCRYVGATYPDLPVVFMTSFGNLENAVEAIRAGVYDFVTKPLEFPQLLHSLDRAVRTRRLESEVTRLRAEVTAGDVASREILGSSDAILEVRRMVTKMAASSAPVLVRGESGSGKALVARGLHLGSARKKHPFVVVNVSTGPPNRVRRELFGEPIRGARGLLDEARGGTLVLDKIGDADIGLQLELVRVLEEGAYSVGGVGEQRPLEARIVATTSRDLESLIDSGDFRADLYHGLAVFEIVLPPLRSRGHDVLQLAQAFLDAAAEDHGSAARRLSAEVAERLLTYPWPGNVRELRNCMERCAVLARYDEITVAELPPRIREFRPDSVLISHDQAHLPLAVVERQYILRVLESVGGNKTEAARILGVGRKTLYRKLEKYGVG